jgi:hypothetical protein
MISTATDDANSMMHSVVVELNLILSNIQPTIISTKVPYAYCFPSREYNELGLLSVVRKDIKNSSC